MGKLRPYILMLLASLGLLAGGISSWAGHPAAANAMWTAATIPVIGALLYQIGVSLKRGDVGLDIVAALSMSTALVFGESLAGIVVALMYSGGQMLESFALGRAEREMTALLNRVARNALRYRGDILEEVPITSLSPGDRLLIRTGEVLPVDGRISGDMALLDLSVLTGESLPKRIARGAEALSGGTSVGAAFDLVATRTAADSTYASIVRLVEEAQESKAPMVRVSDRVAMGFLVLTLALAGTAWSATQDPTRALAVLVVATPCPLILAVPVALIAGMSRAARLGVLIKNGGVLEALAGIRTAVLDKTGTLTRGQISITDITASGEISSSEVLRLAASLDQASSHVVAAALVLAAVDRGLKLSAPTGVDETPGTGVTGRVDGQIVCVGSGAYVSGRIKAPVPTSSGSHHGLTVVVAVDGALAGVIALSDVMRTDAADVIHDLRNVGIRRIILASGDRTEVVQALGKQLRLDAIHAELTPENKAKLVRREAGSAAVMMVGDGVNDAPALAAANVGVAMGARGAAASSEAAGVVLLVDELRPLIRAIALAKRSRRIAFQSVVVGLGLSILAMLAAALGYLPPVQGALLQEVIDVAVILNALRALM